MGRRASSGLLGATLAVVAVVVNSPVVSASAPVEDLPEWLQDVDPAEWGKDAGPELAPWEGSNLVEPGLPEASRRLTIDEPEFPEADEWEATLGGPGDEAAASGRRSDSPITVRTAEEGAPGVDRRATRAVEGEELAVEVLDRAAAERVGASGFVFTVEPDTARGAGELPVEIEIDYSGFADAYGGNYAQRLQLVALPACALESPRPAGCNTRGTPVPARNLGDRQQLVVDAVDLGDLAVDAPLDEEAAEHLAAVADISDAGEADIETERQATDPETWDAPDALAPWASSEGASDPGPALADTDADDADDDEAASARPSEAAGDGSLVFALMADVAGGAGTFAATPLSMTGQWSVAPGSGEFNYSYPIDVPAPAAGTAPTLGLSYSSGAVDGLTFGRNTQASMNGVGWTDFAGGFIEKHYEPCYVYEAHALVTAMPDLCFEGYDRMTLSLDGVSGVMVPLGTDFRQFRLKDDPGWRIERQGNPGLEVDGQQWKVTGPDGTQYFFGLHVDPDTDEYTYGRLWAPVISDEPGEPCWNTAAATIGSCNMVWRWMLDRVVDPDGNVSAYFYDREMNRYIDGPPPLSVQWGGSEVHRGETGSDFQVDYYLHGEEVSRTDWLTFHGVTNASWLDEYDVLHVLDNLFN